MFTEITNIDTCTLQRLLNQNALVFYDIWGGQFVHNKTNNFHSLFIKYNENVAVGRWWLLWQ